MSTQDSHDSELVAALRREIEELEDENEDETIDEKLPDGIVALVRTASVPLEIAAAVDEILADIESTSDEFVSRLRDSVSAALDERGTGIQFFAQLAERDRVHKELSVSDVSAHLHIAAEALERIETGHQAVDKLEAQQVADWIKFLDLELKEALATLEGSLTAPASSFGGDQHEDRRAALDFVAEVRRILSEG